MRFSGFIAVFIVTVAPGLMGCTGMRTQNYSPQNQWLASNFPDRAYHLNQINTAQPYFRDDVIAGQIQLGMSVEEVLIATDTTPFGPKRYKGKFWCDNHTVEHCDASCPHCDGILFFKDQLVWFSGEYQLPTVVDMDHISHQQSIFASAPSQKYHIAEALYRNEIITGMSLNDVTLVLGSLSAAATYFCEDNHGQPPSICDASCEICKIQINPQHSGTVHKVIVLKPHLGEQRVVRIEN